MIKFIKSKKVKYWTLPIIAFIGLAAVVLAVSLSSSAVAESPEQTVEQTAAAATPTPTPEPSIKPTPTPEPTLRPAYIPGPEELLDIPNLNTLSLEQDYIDAEIWGSELRAKWEIDEQADYYLLCVLDAENRVIQKDILWPDIGGWIIIDYHGVGLLLLSYKDMGEDTADDDEIVGAYLNRINAAPTKALEELSDSEEAPQDIMNKYYIIVDKEDNAFAIFAYDENKEYTKRVATFSCALGRSPRMTPIGTFLIGSKGAWKSWNTGYYSPFYTKYASGLYFHGALYRRKSGDTLVEKYYEQIGLNKTSGCIRTTMAGARWIYYNCPAGTVVDIVASSDLVSSPGKPALDPEFPKWDPTDPEKPTDLQLPDA